MIQLVDRLLPPEVRQAILSHEARPQVWLVGGALRDHFLGRENPDLDFAVDGQARRLARTVADKLGAAYFSLDDKRDAARVILGSGGGTLDFVRLRGPSIEGDLQARDFTINAMAILLANGAELLDSLGSLQDLKDRILRACGPQSIRQDPVRALRGVRLATDLQLRVESETLHQLRSASPGLMGSSIERVRDEFARTLQPKIAPSALRLLAELDLLQLLIPELAHDLQIREAALSTVDRLSILLAAITRSNGTQHLTMAEATLRLGRFGEQVTAHLNQRLSGDRCADQILIFAALLSHISDGAKLHHRAHAMRFSGKEVARLRRIAENQHRLRELTPAAEIDPLMKYRFHREANPVSVEVVLLSLASFLAEAAGPPEQARWTQLVESAEALLAAWFVGPEELLNPPRLLRGDELAAELGLLPGPVIGELLEIIKEAQVSGTVGDRHQALDLAREFLGKRG